MEEIVLQLRNKLDEIGKILDNLSVKHDEVIIIKNEDFAYLKWVKKMNSYVHLFEYKNSIRFTLPDSGNSYRYQVNFYNKIMDGSIKEIILNKMDNDSDSEVNYKLEDWHKTKLRELYSNES